MAELTPLEEKLGEVLGLAQAAQNATKTVSSMKDADDFAQDLGRMGEQAAETEKRTEDVVDGREGKKTAIREKARETKSEAADMMKAYLGDEEDALDGFEFLSMAEAGELCHWEIVERMADKLGETEVRTLAEDILTIQREHVKTVREAYLALAAQEV